MKKLICVLILAAMVIGLSGCIPDIPENPIYHLATIQGADYTVILWDGMTFMPFCPVDMADCGRQIGVVNDDENYKAFLYKDLPMLEWVVLLDESDPADVPMLFRELSVTEFPQGLESEYEWNQNLPVAQEEEE